MYQKNRVLRFLWILSLFCPALAVAGQLSLEPREIPDGGVSILHWQGETPSVALAGFNGKSVFFTPTPDGARALLGVDLEISEGTYPVDVMVTDLKGQSSFYHLSLHVRRIERASERLNLPTQMVTPKSPKVLRRIAREQKKVETLYSQTNPAPWSGPFLPPVPSPLGSPFGIRRILNGQPRAPHSGVDFRSPRGTAVKAPARGKVVFTGDMYFTGRTVIIDHGEGLFSLMAHLESVSCHENQSVKQGDIIGFVGSSGRSTGPHLHWSMRWRGERIDPGLLLALPAGKTLTPP